MKRQVMGMVAITLVVVAGGTYVAWTATGGDSDGDTEAWNPSRTSTILYVDESSAQHHLAQVADTAPGAAEVSSGPRCLRAYSARGTTICMRPLVVPAGFEAAVMRGTKVVTRIRVGGTPSRARVSPSGRLVAWTIFRTGDSYAADGAFSTTAGIYDTFTKTRYESLEDFELTIDGAHYKRPDLNYWGVTFVGDDKTFYATAGSGGRTWLVRGDLTSRTLVSLRTNVECPSLAPDGQRVAYKSRVAAGVWRLHVLDLRSGRDWPLAETANVDDQAVWLTADTIGYAKVPPGGKQPGIFVVRADGSGVPVQLRAQASSPAPL